jgi:hypothetical protein
VTCSHKGHTSFLMFGGSTQSQRDTSRVTCSHILFPRKRHTSFLMLGGSTQSQGDTSRVTCSHIPHISILGAHIVPDVWREHTITNRHKSCDMFSQGAHIVSDVRREHTITKRHMSCDMFSHSISSQKAHIVPDVWGSTQSQEDTSRVTCSHKGHTSFLMFGGSTQSQTDTMDHTSRVPCSHKGHTSFLMFGGSTQSQRDTSPMTCSHIPFPF